MVIGYIATLTVLHPKTSILFKSPISCDSYRGTLYAQVCYWHYIERHHNVREGYSLPHKKCVVLMPGNDKHQQIIQCGDGIQNIFSL